MTARIAGLALTGLVLAVLGACQKDEAKATTNPEALTPTTGGACTFVVPDDAPIVLQGRLTHSIDGDSFDVADVEVRLAIVDSPERGEPGYDEATRFTASWFGSEQVAVYRPTSAPSHDRYGRLVGEVMRVRDCSSLNVELARTGNAGLSTSYCHEDPDLADRLGC